MTRWKTSLLLALLLSFGCSLSFGRKLQQIRPGINSAAVEHQLGRPDGVRQLEGFTVYTYFNRLVSDFAWDRADYHVIFNRLDRVVEYGPGAIRVRNNAVILIPVISSGGT